MDDDTTPTEISVQEALFFCGFHVPKKQLTCPESYGQGYVEGSPLSFTVVGNVREAQLLPLFSKHIVLMLMKLKKEEERNFRVARPLLHNSGQRE
jgi:hypothetical protein